jgi:HK97 family phage prohead protease
MELKRLSFAVEGLEVKEDGDARTVEGFASVFNNIDSYNDIVMPGAFAKSIKGRNPVMLWQHDSDEPIGVWDTVEEQKKGLYVKGRILQTSMGNDAYTLVKAGAISGMSIGYAARKWEIDADKGIRKLTEVDLYEVSLVTFPANEKAQITRVKSEDGSLIDERSFEAFLRDAGFSRKEAKIIISDGYKALIPQRDAAEEVQLRNIADMFNQIKL